MRDYKLRKKVLNDYLDTSKLPTKTDAMTSPVGVDADGNLWAEGSTPTGTINITQNGVTDVTNYASANVNVSAETPNLTYVTVTNNIVSGLSIYIVAYQSGKFDTWFEIPYGESVNIPIRQWSAGTQYNGCCWLFYSNGRADPYTISVAASPSSCKAYLTYCYENTQTLRWIYSLLVECKSTATNTITLTQS